MSDIGQLTSTYIGMILVIGGLAFAASRLGRIVRTRQNTGESLSHLTTLVLTPQCSVAIVRTAHEELLLGLSGQHITILTKTALAPSTSRATPTKATTSLTTCKRQSRMRASRTQQVFPQRQFFSGPKSPQ